MTKLEVHLNKDSGVSVLGGSLIISAQGGGASFQNRKLIGEVGTTTPQPRDIQLYEKIS